MEGHFYISLDVYYTGLGLGLFGYDVFIPVVDMFLKFHRWLDILVGFSSYSCGFFSDLFHCFSSFMIPIAPEIRLYARPYAQVSVIQSPYAS